MSSDGIFWGCLFHNRKNHHCFYWNILFARVCQFIDTSPYLVNFTGTSQRKLKLNFQAEFVIQVEVIHHTQSALQNFHHYGSENMCFTTVAVLFGKLPVWFFFEGSTEIVEGYNVHCPRKQACPREKSSGSLPETNISEFDSLKTWRKRFSPTLPSKLFPLKAIENGNIVKRFQKEEAKLVAYVMLAIGSSTLRFLPGHLQRLVTITQKKKKW